MPSGSQPQPNMPLGQTANDASAVDNCKISYCSARVGKIALTYLNSNAQYRILTAFFADIIEDYQPHPIGGYADFTVEVKIVAVFKMLIA